MGGRAKSPKLPQTSENPPSKTAQAPASPSVQKVASNSKQLGGCTGAGFKPGQSGNPSGKSKEAAKIEQESKLLALRACPKALKRLEYWRDSDNPKASVTASIALLERGLGKPTQWVAGDPTNPVQVAVISFVGAVR